MPKEILIVKNIPREGPGLLEGVLKERNLKYSVIDLEAGDVFPAPHAYGAVVVLGGPDSANDETEKMRIELARIKETLAAGIPYLGICLGLQTLVKAAGGKVVNNAVREIGFQGPDGGIFLVDLTEVGKRDPLFEGLGDTFNVFHLHGETVELTDGMALLGTGKFCRNQIVRVGRSAYGLQCHFELTPEMLETWLAQDPDLQKLDKDELRADFESQRERYTQVGRRLFRNFLNGAGL